MTSNILPGLQANAVPIDSLKNFEGNPNIGNVEAIARSLETLGQHRLLVVDQEGNVIVGNHTLMAAKQLGWDEIAVLVTDDDPETARARP
jgi:ParB-like chromosome segregation protein Spo0J